MRLLLTVVLVSKTLAMPDGINFGGSSSSNDKDVSNRIDGNKKNGFAQTQCCCVPNSQSCVDNIQEHGHGDDLVGQGFINERVVNRPPGSASLTCQYGNKLCCFENVEEYDFSIFGRTCVPPKDGGKGSQGSSGNNGYPGSSGSNGYPGSSGSNGYPGSSGSNGYPGSSGSNGYPGSSGSNGYPGSSGSNVYPGSSGSNGYPGSSGNNGNYGSSGNYGWRQGCNENVNSYSQCGNRDYQYPAYGVKYGESSPGEFPWTCLILDDNNNFLGTCAIVPERFDNDLNRGTRKIITAAHNLNKINYGENLKVRVGEYNANEFKNPETIRHEEYSVLTYRKHPSFDRKRLSNDIAVLRLDRNINLRHKYVNAACLPSCENQFAHQFNNGTGVRCWVAGWGKDEFDGSFQYIQHKVDVPIVSDSKCEFSLKRALNQQQYGVGDRFRLDGSEICAGTETGKDACTGDGGSPLVCQAQSGRWTVVGLVSWGIGCATEVPGVYTNVAYFRNWIEQQ